MKITESQIRRIVRESLNNLRNSNIGEIAREKAAYIENKIRDLQYRVNLLMGVENVINEVNNEMERNFNGNISASTIESDCLIYVFMRPLEYDENGNVGFGSGYIEDDIKDMFPKEYQNYIYVLPIDDEMGVKGVKIYFDIDEIYDDDIYGD